MAKKQTTQQIINTQKLPKTNPYTDQYGFPDTETYNAIKAFEKSKAKQKRCL